MADVKITYETLFDLLRREKNRSELQPLDQTFYVDVISYLREKTASLEGKDSSSPLFSHAEKEKIKIQLKNVKKIIVELYELREKKILALAMTQVRTGSKLIDKSSMLLYEHRLFDDAVNLLSSYKENVQLRVLEMVLPEISDSAQTSNRQYSSAENKTDEETPVKESLSEDRNEEPNPNSKVIFSTDLPKFVGTDKKIYGPYKKGDSDRLPTAIAELLVKKGRATY